ncbi:unnamed protein product [Ceratitis capitata]|uniref:(Mediterranean fruit fly) hypothetical protein n=1 Tax=Ceratitis capitata TaxID=7213 RepID=A0A811U0Z7_CERCA|nr:unnamed protein product [Ceratitis capitata]
MLFNSLVPCKVHLSVDNDVGANSALQDTTERGTKHLDTVVNWVVNGNSVMTTINSEEREKDNSQQQCGEQH